MSNTCVQILSQYLGVKALDPRYVINKIDYNHRHTIYLKVDLAKLLLHYVLVDFLLHILHVGVEIVIPEASRGLARFLSFKKALL